MRRFWPWPISAGSFLLGWATPRLSRRTCHPTARSAGDPPTAAPPPTVTAGPGSARPRSTTSRNAVRPCQALLGVAARSQDQGQEARGPHRGEDVTSIPLSRAAAMNQRASWDIQHLTRSASRSTGASRRRISSARRLGVGERLSPIMAPRGTRARRRGARGAGSRAWPAPPAGSPPGSSTRRTPPGATGREPRSSQ